MLNIYCNLVTKKKNKNIFNYICTYLSTISQLYFNYIFWYYMSYIFDLVLDLNYKEKSFYFKNKTSTMFVKYFIGILR